ncbi:MAG: O-antigen ligase family protein [Bacteroidota bacterium]|nr:O-antigen ligase family protein [Bacteroidota bacterium]
MNRPKVIFQYIKEQFIETGSGKPGNWFWSLLVLGLFFLPLGVFPSNVFLITAIPFGLFMLSGHFHFKWGLKNLAMLSYPLLFIFMAISLTYSFDLNIGIKLLSRSVPLFFFPIIFLFASSTEKHLIKIINALSLGLVFSFIINLISATNNSIYWDGGNLVFDTSLNRGYSFFESFNHGGNNFFGGEFAKHVHPSYLSCYLLLCVSHMIFKNENRKKMALVLVLLVYLFLLASRAAFLCLGLLLIVYLFKSNGLGLFLKRVMIALSLFALYFFLNPRALNFYERMGVFFKMEQYDYTTSEQSRALVYATAVDLIKKSPIVGYGIGDANEELYIQYVDKNYITLMNNRYNAHNQYFQTFIQMGVIGFLFLFFPLFIGVFKANEKFVFSAFLVLSICLLFESMLIRYHGIIIYAVMVPLLIKLSGTISRNGA